MELDILIEAEDVLRNVASMSFASSKSLVGKKGTSRERSALWLASRRAYGMANKIKEVIDDKVDVLASQYELCIR